MNSLPVVKITDEVINTQKHKLPEDSDLGPLPSPAPLNLVLLFPPHCKAISTRTTASHDSQMLTTSRLQTHYGQTLEAGSGPNNTIKQVT